MSAWCDIPNTCALAYRLRGVQHRYDQRLALDLPAWEVRAGSVTAVVGPSGAGKSTLLRLLALLEPPSAGEVISRPAGPPLAPGQVTLVYQRPLLLRTSVYENAALGLRLRGKRGRLPAVDALLERLSLMRQARRPVASLSGGEQQRVALARALALGPEVLLLDEPTANLDPAHVALVEEIIRERQQDTGMTVVWVTHNLFQARRISSELLVLWEGRPLAAGSTEAVFAAPGSPEAQAFLRGERIW
ncbi:MAG: ATP-binding cassette domain-containing protein [Armatimonadetes bacterium]|nr:ATP-binding cassette domain-containing protein [Armatimonadota bacterium]